MSSSSYAKTDGRSKTGGSLLKSAQFRDHLVAELANGRFKPGTALPPEKLLAEEFRISRPTVRRALAEMEFEGLIRREQGRGTFVSENVQQKLQKTTGAFALVISGSRDSTGLALIHGFEQHCRKTQHNMLLFDSENDFNQQGELILRLSQMNVAGVAVLPVSSPSTPSYHALAIQSQGIPLVFCHRSAEEAKAPLLAIPHEEQGRIVGRALGEQGHRRVAMMIGYRAERLTEKWTRGIRNSLREFGGELPDEFVFGCKTTSIDPKEHEAEFTEALKRILSDERPPTAIFAVIDDFAEAIYFVLKDMGMRVPEDISLVGLGNANRETPFLRRLTSVAFDNEDLSRRAVELLCEMQSGKRGLYDTETITMPVALTDGMTLGPAPKSKVES